MQIEVSKTGKRLHVQPELGSVLAELGLVVVIQPAAPVKPPSDLLWGIRYGMSDGTPILGAQCPACKQTFNFAVYPYSSDERNGRTRSTRYISAAEQAPAYIKNAKVWHCGKGDVVPSGWQERFIRENEARG